MQQPVEQAAFLNEIEPIMSALGTTFAQAFASYTVEVLRLSRTQGLLAPALRNQGVPGVSESLAGDLSIMEGADDCVRASYLASLREDAPRMDLEEARSRVAGSRLIRALRARGMTQAELARKVGMKPASLSRVLKQPHKSRTSTLLKIAKAMDLDISDILA